MAPQTIIRRAITTIAEQYTPGVEKWLAEKNPLALRTLATLQARLDAVACGDDDQATQRAANAWQGNWLFWCKQYKATGGK